VYCTLVAHWGLASPSVELALYPAAILRNEMPYAMEIITRDGRLLASAPPRATVMFDWAGANGGGREGGVRGGLPPPRVYVRPHSRDGQSNRGMIRMQDGHCALLTLWQQLPTGEGGQGEEPPRLQCHMVAASVQTTLRDGDAAQPAVHISSATGRQRQVRIICGVPHSD
jgi:hypothetical protein